ncbi:hypothetical protein D1007_17083 [Hordeum vulgare]|nr:hypothetical protein D1007_17083 [Hordeum vulgare]
MAVILKLHGGDGRRFTKLNQAHIVLIPKKPDAEEIGDYHPISLPHNIPKLFAKVLENRLRRRMKEIVGNNQPAFIKGRHIHDNFLLVRHVARRIHARKVPWVFLKLDISRAFDYLSWPFLFEVMNAKGLGAGWNNWIAILLRTTTTKVIVNGVPSKSFGHACGLPQGDPISPPLFVIAMDVLSALVNKALELGVPSNFSGITDMQRISVYADDVALFIKPSTQDLNLVKATLDAWLWVNYEKSSTIMIRGEPEDQMRVSALLHCDLAEFPCKYLGPPLATKNLTRVGWQPLLDQVRNCVPAWQRGLIQRPGRLILGQSIISAIPIHHLMVMDARVWVLEEINKWM